VPRHQLKIELKTHDFEPGLFRFAALNFPARIDSWKDMTVAEDLGFTSVWFYDSQMLYSDIYATMTLVAEHTKCIRIGTRIAVPSNRIAPVTTHSIATINQMVPGRAMLGIGTGFTGRNMMGLPPVRLAPRVSHRARRCF